jgi:hypothetical protein
MNVEFGGGMDDGKDMGKGCRGCLAKGDTGSKSTVPPTVGGVIECRVNTPALATSSAKLMKATPAALLPVPLPPEPRTKLRLRLLLLASRISTGTPCPPSLGKPSISSSCGGVGIATPGLAKVLPLASSAPVDNAIRFPSVELDVRVDISE